jgi:hypothetical protein
MGRDREAGIPGQENRRAQEAMEKAKARLEEVKELSKPMQTVVLDGDGAVAYFVGKGNLDLEETVVAVPLTKLLIFLGEVLKAVIAPTFAGQAVTQRRGGGDEPPKKNILTS